MIFLKPSVDTFGIAWLIVLSASLWLGSVEGNNGLDMEPFEDTRNAIPYQYGTYYESPKRAGFVGMRGKKAMDDLEADESLKEEYFDPAYYGQFARAVRAGFVGMRGKKEDDQNNGGKRAGFVGMRGKKADYFPFWYSNIKNLEDSIEPSKARRATSGFVGMRGR